MNTKIQNSEKQRLWVQYEAILQLMEIFTRSMYYIHNIFNVLSAKIKGDEEGEGRRQSQNQRLNYTLTQFTSSCISLSK